MILLTVHDSDSSSFWFWSVSEICRFLCLPLMRSFVVQFFEDLMWLVKSSWCVHCCSNHQFYCVSDRCRSEFALWWFFVRKKLSSKYWQFFFLFGLDYQTFLVFINLKDRAAFLGLIMHLFTCWCYLGALNNCFQFFSVESCLFMCLSVTRFFSLKVFPFLITASGWYYHFDVLIFVHLFSSTEVVVIALANLSWSVLSQ